MILHTLNKQSSDLVQLCISALGPEDSLLLVEDAVYAALGATGSPLDLAILPAGIKLYALVEDLAARGISEKIPDVFTRITYRDFVTLSLACSKVVNWN